MKCFMQAFWAKLTTLHAVFVLLFFSWIPYPSFQQQTGHNEVAGKLDAVDPGCLAYEQEALKLSPPIITGHMQIKPDRQPGLGSLF